MDDNWKWNQVCTWCGKPLLITYDQGRPCWGTHLKHVACLRAELVAERLLRSPFTREEEDE